MNILVTCSYWYYSDFSSSFIHAQAKAYAAAGQRVRVLIPLPLGSHRLPDGAVRITPLLHCLERDGVEICYFSALSLSNFGNHRLGGFSLNVRAAIFALQLQFPIIFRDFKPDIVHAHAFGYGDMVGKWLSERLSCPLVVTTHGGDAGTLFEGGQRESLCRQCETIDAIVAVSAKLATGVRSCGTAAPIHTIFNGFAADNVTTAEKLPHSMIQVGNLIPSKHNDYTLQAVARLREQYSDITLTVVGGGTEQPRLEKLTATLSLTGCVRFLGHLPNAEALAEMAKSRFFVMPSYPEGFGIVYLEAMASGCITIGTEGEGISDFIIHGENGFLVPPDDVDAIVKVIDWCLSHPAEADAIAERGKADAIAMTWEHNAQQYLALFETLIKKQRS